jgi:undecaprenyl diphosphate synthase
MTNSALPVHLGIIMDGNGRWAKKRGLPRSAGHAAGAAVFKTITRYCSSIGIKYLTIYAFSTENWKRPHDEVVALMGLFKQYLDDALTNFLDDTVKLRFIGDTSVFDPQLRGLIEKTERISEKRTGMVLNLAMNYGGRAEIVRAARLLAQEAKDGAVDPGDITEELFANRLYTAGQPDPDLIIRPSGENRMSNFLLWQCAYSEFVDMDLLWPDFRTEDLDRALKVYAGRGRRFGGV